MTVSPTAAGISPSYALRGVELDRATSRVRFVNATDPGRFICPIVTPHPIYGAATVGSRVCTAAEGGPDDWRFDPKTGTVRLSQQSPSSSSSSQRQQQQQHGGTPCLELVYSTNKTNFVLFARDCSAVDDDNHDDNDNNDDDDDGDDGDMSNQFAIVNSSITGGSREPARYSTLPEGGSSMLKAVRMDNKTAPGGGNSKWVADGGCVALVKPNLNITMGVATWLFFGNDRPVPANGAPNISGKLSVSVKFALAPGETYILKTSLQTNRPPAAIKADQSALERACITIATNATLELESAHTAWWDHWWSMSSIDLGPHRQLLESFYYGAHYLLGSFSRPGGVTAGLLGPWSMQVRCLSLSFHRLPLPFTAVLLQDPVGWFDDLTLDYNVEANYWGAASANRLEAMTNYFATMDAMVPLCEKRAALKTWGRGGHGSSATWGQQTDMMGCGPEGWAAMEHCPADMGGYDGMECPSGMAAFPDIYTGHDSSTRFVAGLMATPYIDYYEHSMDREFLAKSAYPFVRNVAEFYASYATKNTSEAGRYDLMYTCAQEVCQWRQDHGSQHVNHNSLVDLSHATMALQKATEWSQLLNVDSRLRPRWAVVLAGLPHLPVTSDNASLAHGPAGIPLIGAPARRVWSEARYVKATKPKTTLAVAPFATNYMFPIIHFAAIHPCGLLGLHSNKLRGSAQHEVMLATAINTVWGDNERSSWHNTNGLCLSWPSATRVTNGSAPGHGAALLDRYEHALNATMQPNFWPDMGGGGLEQAGAAVAVDELLLQSHEGYLVLFPAWERGVSAASFSTLRARGAFLVTAAIDAGGQVRLSSNSSDLALDESLLMNRVRQSGAAQG